MRQGAPRRLALSAAHPGARLTLVGLPWARAGGPAPAAALKEALRLLAGHAASP